MLKFTADFILNPQGKLVSNHILITDGQGKIIDLIQGNDSESVYHEGIITPGFINTHCHLELSYLLNQIPEGNGLIEFIRNFIRARNNNSTDSMPSILKADKQMWEDGTQAVGDVCNTDLTFKLKHSSRIRYHSFIEIFNFNRGTAISTLNSGIENYNSAIASHSFASVIPHAPYSVPPELFQLIKTYNDNRHSVWSIHNQESAGENEMFTNGKGSLLHFLTETGINMGWFSPSGKNSLPSISKYFPEKSNILLVHNTFTEKSDIDFLISKNQLGHTWFSLCVKANLYIEKQVPDINMLNKSGCNLTIGTDSLASNNSLSILEELKTIHDLFPHIPIETLLTWATINGAACFGWNDLGAFNKNNSPGILWISKADKSKINSDSVVRRICG